MKNKFIIKFLIILFFLFSKNLFAEELDITALKIELTKKNQVVLAEGDVKISDVKNNIILSDKVKYNKTKDYVESIGKTEITTSESYKVDGQNIFYDNKKGIIYSTNDTVIYDKSGNQIYVEMFNYLVEKNLFFSKGKVKIIDNRDNEYFFSEIYIDEKTKKIVGSDIKSFFNEKPFGGDERNKPRFFANSGTIAEGNTIFQKGVFTVCQYREKDKCPPWEIRAKKIEHNAAKKTIYYEDAVLKIYDFPIFYFPKFFHPDPTVKRKSGFLIPTFRDNSTVGYSATLPYFWAISDSKDMTITPKLYGEENILVLNEYRQAFKKGFLFVDTSYTEGYKKTNNKKLPGSRSHFFSKFNIDFAENEEYVSNLEINIQRVSNPTYLEVHKINTDLVDYNNKILQNEIKYEFQGKENYFGLTGSVFENTSITGRERYEYIFPNINFERNLISNDKIGILDFNGNAFAKNYKVDQETKFLVNDLNWKSRSFVSLGGIESRFEGIIKAVNYEADNADKYKTDGFNSELSSAISYNAELPLIKRDKSNSRIGFLIPKFSLRHAPSQMRNIDDDDLRLSYSNLFSLNKNSQIDVIEEGTSATLGFEISSNDINANNLGDKKYSVSLGQVYNFEESPLRPRKSSLDQKTSDLVGETYFKLNENFSISNTFSLDHNFNTINYNNMEAKLILGNTNFNVKYLEENNHVGSNGYIRSDVSIDLNDTSELTFDIKKNLETDSTEFYNLAYSYINDCLKAGLVFRREFYSDRDIESSDSLMFKVSLLPFGSVLSSPLIDR